MGPVPPVSLLELGLMEEMLAARGISVMHETIRQ
jgi:transposase-like protein